MRASAQVDLDALVEACRDPVSFARVILNHDTWSTNEAILTAVKDHDQVSVRACHASAKTWSAAEVVLWWLVRGEDHLAITTAPTWNQVQRLMWGEIKKSISQSLWPFPAALNAELRLGPNNYAIGLSTDEGVRFQGFHGNILIVADEAVGISMDIFEAIEGIRAGGNVKLLMLGNPTVPGGYFYDSFFNPNFKKFHIDAYDTPNLLDLPGETAQEREQWLASLPESWDNLDAETREFLTYNPRPYLAKRRWVWEKLHQWGPDSPFYQSRVRGDFPSQDTYALYPMSAVEAAAAREGVRMPPFQAGVDVAGPGDNETVSTIRAGDLILTQKAWRLADSRDAVAAHLAPYKQHGLVVAVDATGIGYHMATYLKGLGFRVKFVNAANSPTPGRMAGEDLNNRDRFVDLKAQYAWDFRLRLIRGAVAGLTDELTRSQLQALKYKEQNGKIKIETKAEARARGVKSPDRAESVILAFAEDHVGSFVVY